MASLTHFLTIIVLTVVPLLLISATATRPCCTTQNPTPTPNSNGGDVSSSGTLRGRYVSNDPMGVIILLLASVGYGTMFYLTTKFSLWLVRVCYFCILRNYGDEVSPRKSDYVQVPSGVADAASSQPQPERVDII